MPDFLVSTLTAFGCVLALVAATAGILGGIAVVAIARKEDRPIELSPGSAAYCAIVIGVLVGWKALDVLGGISL